MNYDWEGLSISFGVLALVMLILLFGPYPWYKYAKILYCPRDKIKCNFVGFYDASITRGNDVGHFKCPRCGNLYNEWGNERNSRLGYFSEVNS